ncbi:MAG: glycosyltransferase [Cytophagales bacterium]|nr:glycosyltransferase [Cytophagales bacterium]
MDANQNFIIVSITPWDFEMGNNAKNLAIEMAKNQRVLYVNPALDRFTLWKDRNNPKVKKRLEIIRGKREGLEKISENLYVLTPSSIIESIHWISNRFIFSILNRMNNKLVSREILKVTKKIGFDKFYLINDSDMFRSYYFKELLHPLKYIYYSRDNLMAVDYWRKHGNYFEPQLVKKSDVALANSLYLANELLKHNQNSFDVGQGCDLESFTEKIENPATPPDIQAIPGPKIGYTGALYSLRLDLELIAHLAKERPQWSIVLVGPEDSTFKKSELHQLPNVYFLGNKDPKELRAYIESFDVCINPQVLNEVTIGNYPRKIDEYLALGKPVVATRTKAMEIFEPHACLAESKSEYITLIEKALEENSDEKIAARKSLASSHSWENNVKRIYEAIEK